MDCSLQALPSMGFSRLTPSALNRSHTSLHLHLFIYEKGACTKVIKLSSRPSMHCCCSVAQSCPTLCNLMDCSMPGFPVLHYLPKLSQTHVHRVGDAIQPSCPRSSPSPPAFNLSQHQGLLQPNMYWIGPKFHSDVIEKPEWSFGPTQNFNKWFLLINV